MTASTSYPWNLPTPEVLRHETGGTVSLAWSVFEPMDEKKNSLQCWAKEWCLGCVNTPPVARGSQKAGFTQPRVLSYNFDE